MSTTAKYGNPQQALWSYLVLTNSSYSFVNAFKYPDTKNWHSLQPYYKYILLECGKCDPTIYMILPVYYIYIIYSNWATIKTNVVNKVFKARLLVILFEGIIQQDDRNKHGILKIENN